MMKIIRHQVSEGLDENLTQCCFMCGKEILNYQNASWPAGQPAPKGFQAGPVYQTEGVNPTVTSIFLSPGETFTDCME